MDTYKDAVMLNDLWASGAAPWRARMSVALKRALVTGAHGFVASHLARALLERGDAVAGRGLAAGRRLPSGLQLRVLRRIWSWSRGTFATRDGRCDA